MATYGILCIHCGVNSATPSGALPCSYHSGGHRFFFPTDGPQVVVPETVAAPVERAPPSTEQVAVLIAAECDAIKALLLQKNAAYGNSAFDTVRIFSKADRLEQIKVRLDDKLSRLARGSAAGEDVEQDLLGYLVLLRVARKL